LLEVVVCVLPMVLNKDGPPSETTMKERFVAAFCLCVVGYVMCVVWHTVGHYAGGGAAPFVGNDKTTSPPTPVIFALATIVLSTFFSAMPIVMGFRDARRHRQELQETVGQEDSAA
jgi:hypothetical protein